MADDIPIDLVKMTLWTENEASVFFESGGEDAPPPTVIPPIQTIGSGDAVASAQAKERGNTLTKSGDFDNAAAAYREALALGSPEPAPLHSNLSFALLKSGDVPEALIQAELCVAARPEWSKAHFRLGEALFATRAYMRAQAAYAEALRLAPGDGALKLAENLAKEALAGGVWFRQLLPGAHIPGRMLNVFGYQQ